ncbi:GTPase Mtg2p, mitochondrial [[Candida] anglica]|uniref:GTPase Mtg2p, mitochondrial n=1 Tax=[Candida] anglica TaxID=148631 RepID=A0ABP0ELW8_9ASCO
MLSTIVARRSRIIRLQTIRSLSIYSKRSISASSKVQNSTSNPIPENAPSLEENEEWLSRLSEDEVLSEEDASDLNFTESVFPNNFILTKGKGTLRKPEGEVRTLQDLNYKVVGTDKHGFKEICMTLKDYFMGSEYSQSIFSRFSGGSGNNRVAQARRVEQKTFVDLKIVNISSGKGGNGCVSFLRDAHRPVGPPDGGDGGDGGNVYIRVMEGSSLHKVRKTYKANGGCAGGGSQLDGKRGDDVIIDVPVGTTVRWIPEPTDIKKLLKETKGDLADTEFHLKAIGSYPNDECISNVQLFRDSFAPGEGWLFKDKTYEYHLERNFFNDLNKSVTIYDKEIIREEIASDRFPLLGIDFSEPNMKPQLLLKGGKGGMGNMHFLTKDIRNPRFAKSGREGISGSFLFELKLIADLGLVGLPNAGKSTLLRAISRARPRVGHWEFTTLQPTIGTIFTRIDKDPFTVADIPGIIKGAAQNKGMGLDFLRHIERSGGLVFVVSLDGEDPVSDLEVLIEELGPKKLEAKKILIVATKADLTKDGEKFMVLKDYVESKDWKIVPVCAIKGENIERCIQMMSETAGKTEV